MNNNPNFIDVENNKKKRIALIHKVLLSQLKTNRKYTASTKTKSEVRGGGRKPWQQKGTGKARAGSSRSPLWVGGGVVFGPKPRVVYKKVNKKERRLAIISAFYLKQNKTTILDPQLLENSTSLKTKNIEILLKELNISKEEKTLIITPRINANLWLSLRNLKNVTLTLVSCLNVEQILNVNNIILSTDSVVALNEIYGKKSR